MSNDFETTKKMAGALRPLLDGLAERGQLDALEEHPLGAIGRNIDEQRDRVIARMAPELGAGMGHAGWRGTLVGEVTSFSVGGKELPADTYRDGGCLAELSLTAFRAQTEHAEQHGGDEPVETQTGNSIAYDEAAFQYVERPPLTLDEIVAAVRTNDLVTGRDMRYAIVAFDVLMSQLHVDRNVEQLAEFFKAASSPPREYIGEANDPENPEAVEWYKAMRL